MQSTPNLSKICKSERKETFYEMDPRVSKVVEILGKRFGIA